MIDAFCHVIPPKFKEALFKKSRPTWYIENTKTLPALWDLDLRFKAMDRYEGMVQLLTLGMPSIEYATILGSGNTCDGRTRSRDR